MRKSFMSKACLALFLFATCSISSCEKLSELNEEVDEAVEEMLGIKALTEDLSKTSSNFNEIKNLLIDGRDASSEIKIKVGSSVSYRYDHKRYTLSGSMWTIKTTSYSGSIPKSYFTNKSSANIVKVSVQNNVPKLYVNGSLAASGTTSGSTGSTGGSTGGSGTGSGSTTPTTQVLVDKDLSGESYEKKTISFTLPSGVKTMVVRTTESNSAYRNTADLFVRKGSAPVVNGPKPPSWTPAYSWTADCNGIQPNRVDEVCTFNNPGSGTWYITLYGYNTYFSSRVLVTITK